MKLLIAFPALALSLNQCSAFTVPINVRQETSLSKWKLSASVENEQNMFFATDEKTSDSLIDEAEQRRVLGSQENLMLPRQYGVNPDVEFPQMNHVSAVVLSATPSAEVLKQAIDDAMQAHPLLRCHVEGDGEPEERIDLSQMVRKGDPNPCTFVSSKRTFTSADVLKLVDVEGTTKADIDKSWRADFNRDLDDGHYWCDPSSGPLWKIELHRLNKGTDKDAPCALLFTFNHCISDQSSVNILTDQIISNMAAIEENGKILKPAVSQSMPISVEDTVMGLGHRFSDTAFSDFDLNTVTYVAGKAAEGLRSPVILPDMETEKKGNGVLGAISIIGGKTAGGDNEASYERTSTLQFRNLSKEATSALLAKCRENGVTVTNALSAALTLTATDFIGNGLSRGKDKKRNYKVLQSLNMRRFGEQLDKCETVACHAGSMDLMHGPFSDHSGESLRTDPTDDKRAKFWELAREGKDQTAKFVENEGPKNAVRVFDFAMTISDMNNLVHLTALSKDTQGRAYSAGISNVGVYERQQAVRREGDDERDTIQIKHGRYNIDDMYFAVSNARTGCLYQISCMTVDGEMKIVSHPATPVVSEQTNEQFADAFVDLVEVMAGTKEKVTDVDDSASISGGDSSGITSVVTENGLVLVASVFGLGAIASHAPAFYDFYQSVMQMKENIADPQDFWAALNFWIFFAVGHPILQPVLWISDVLHGSPGPKLADLVPYTYLLGNAVAIGAIAMSKQIRNAVNIAAVAAFFAYVGAGLDGQAGLGDFNLALDDTYKGQIVRGCPTYEEVRQPSMDNFDLDKYQGKWYEQKFHDWTQFKEVYDTTLDIKLTPDGKGWIDDFGVKGPAPDSAKLSWDKSPVANGAHYFLFGRVDDKDPAGVLRESGFGVEFPNYIVDVQKDPTTGEYTEAIQFQCLERGGVRVFEGINFMSRNPTMTDEEIAAMHARAEKAGMYPYGASPEQMHTVARRPVDAAPEDNAWQQMWHNIGFDRLLELLTESIEDGGR